jgi:nucleoside-diphosphate-sugar epimerase
VIHVAAPVIFQPKDPENDVIKPAIGITQNVLQHALKAGIKVILQCDKTSHVARSKSHPSARRNHIYNGHTVR